MIPRKQCRGAVLGLKVADEDFILTFASAVRRAFGLTVRARREGPYWVAKIGRIGVFDDLKTREPETRDEVRWWLRGFFDSEGNASLTRSKISENSWSRRVAFFNTDVALIDRARGYLDLLEIETLTYTMKPSRGHLGTKPVFELLVRSGQENYWRFGELVGSSIARKAQALQAIPRSYVPDLSEHCRQAQRKGSTARWGRR